MTLSTAEFIRSINPDFHWVNQKNKGMIKRTYKLTIDGLTDKLIENNQYIRMQKQEFDKFADLWALEMLVEQVQKDNIYLEKLIKRYQYFINELNGKIKKLGQITDEDIVRASEVPIESLYEGRLRYVSGRLLGRCPFHADGQERTPSFVLYKTQNSWWCYSCNEGGSSIDFIMKSQNIKFLEAIKFLIQK